MATITDIAKMAGVSTSTVSHVVNKTRFVSPELVERVEKAIQELDHPPNFVIKKNKSLTQSSTDAKYVLFLKSNRKSNFQQQIEKQAEALLKNTPYTLLSFEYSYDPNRLDIINRYLTNAPEAAGAIVFPDEEETIQESFLNLVNFPVVILGRELENYKADTIVSDSCDGGYKATRHLIKNGHEQIAYLGSSQDRSPKRLTGFTQALEEYGIEANPKYIVTNLHSSQDIYNVLNQLFTGYDAPTAILAANYSILLPLLHYMDSHNINCPNDVSLVVFNEFDWAALHNPPLTTVEQNTAEIANQAVSALIERINSPTLLPYKKVVLPSKLNVRDSTCGIGRGPFGEKAETIDSLALTPSEEQTLREKNYTAAISFHYAGKAWMELHQKGIRDIFDNLGISIIAITDAHFNPELQCRQLESLKLLEPDILIAIPTDNEKTAHAFQNITHSSSKLILITNVPDGLTPDDYVCCVSVNEHSHGRNMGHGLGEYMQKHGLTKLAFIKHGANFYATNQRDRAAEQVITEEYPELQVCGTIAFCSEEDVFKQTLDLVKRHPEIEALYISWEGPAMEAMAALTQMERTDIAIVTGDLDYSIAQNLAKGGMIKMISAQCSYEQGQAIAMAAANALLHKKTPSFIGIEPIVVTPENLLKSWKKVFKEEPSSALKLALKENPNYIFSKD